jgi:hypothetical protein
VPDRTVGHRAAFLVRHLDLEAGHYLAQRPTANTTHTIGEEDVPLLRSAKAVEEWHLEELIPPGVQLFGQSLSRGGGQA